MPPSNADATALARDVRQLLTLAGLPESREDSSAGGYQISTYSDRVRVTWWTQDAFEDEAGQIGVHHRQHPLARLGRDVVTVMERAVADVLYAAGFTVVLRPGVPNTDLDKAADPEVIVAAGPAFRAWASG
jgi:hypothetical protein